MTKQLKSLKEYNVDMKEEDIARWLVVALKM